MYHVYIYIFQYIHTAVSSGTFKGFVRVEIEMLVCERVRSLELRVPMRFDLLRK